MCEWRWHGNWNSSWCSDILQFPPKLFALQEYSTAKLSDFCSSVHALLFAGFPLEGKFQTPAGFAKNKLLQTFGFHLKYVLPSLVSAHGDFSLKQQIFWGGGNSTGAAPALPIFPMDWDTGGGYMKNIEAKILQHHWMNQRCSRLAGGNLATAQLVNQDGNVKEKRFKNLGWKKVFLFMAEGGTG